MVAFKDYSARYKNVTMKRENGILEVALHTDGGPLVFDGYVHEDLLDAFRDIGDDRENRRNTDHSREEVGGNWC